MKNIRTQKGVKLCPQIQNKTFTDQWLLEQPPTVVRKIKKDPAKITTIFIKSLEKTVIENVIIPTCRKLPNRPKGRIKYSLR